MEGKSGGRKKGVEQSRTREGRGEERGVEGRCVTVSVQPEHKKGEEKEDR